jgi:hypothetical protein
MQVSWIDSDQLKGLLERLGDSVPQAKPGTQTWETHTMPEALVEADLMSPVMAEEAQAAEPEVAVMGWEAAATVADERAKTAVAVEEDEVSEGASPEEVAPEVARIRDRLREVRERAEAAGLLKRPVTAISRSVASPVALPVAQSAVVQPVTLPAAAVVVRDNDGVAESKRSPLVVKEEDEVQAGAAGEPGKETLGAYFEVPVGSVVERLEAFAQWAHQQVLPGELVLLDEHGDVLWGTQAKGALILSAMMAANALSRSSAVGACQAEAKVIRQALSGGGELAVLSCVTQAGLVHLAVEHPVRVGDAAMRLLGQALSSAISAGT